MSRANGELVGAVERWRTRDLSQEKIKYLLLDGVNFSMRVGKSVETVPVLVAIGVREDGPRLVLGLQAGDKESAACWLAGVLQGFKESRACRRDRDVGRHGRFGGAGNGL